MSRWAGIRIPPSLHCNVPRRTEMYSLSTNRIIKVSTSSVFVYFIDGHSPALSKSLAPVLLCQLRGRVARLGDDRVLAAVCRRLRRSYSVRLHRHVGQVALCLTTHLAMHLLQNIWPHGRRRTCLRGRNSSQHITHTRSSSGPVKSERRNTCTGAVKSSLGTLTVSRGWHSSFSNDWRRNASRSQKSASGTCTPGGTVMVRSMSTGGSPGGPENDRCTTEDCNAISNIIHAT